MHVPTYELLEARIGRLQVIVLPAVSMLQHLLHDHVVREELCQQCSNYDLTSVINNTGNSEFAVRHTDARPRHAGDVRLPLSAKSARLSSGPQRCHAISSAAAAGSADGPADLSAGQLRLAAKLARLRHGSPPPCLCTSSCPSSAEPAQVQALQAVCTASSGCCGWLAQCCQDVFGSMHRLFPACLESARVPGGTVGLLPSSKHAKVLLTMVQMIPTTACGAAGCATCPARRCRRRWRGRA